jgi:ArsR family transcriptional regulator
MKAKRAKKATPSDCNLPDEVANAIEEIGGLKFLASSIPSARQLNKQVKVHHVLSDKTRLKIMWTINCCDLCPCVLIEFLKIPNPKLSYHLRVLEMAGLVRVYPKKNWKIYSITDLGREVLACSHEFGIKQIK